MSNHTMDVGEAGSHVPCGQCLSQSGKRGCIVRKQHEPGLEPGSPAPGKCTALWLLSYSSPDHCTRPARMSSILGFTRLCAFATCVCASPPLTDARAHPGMDIC